MKYWLSGSLCMLVSVSTLAEVQENIPVKFAFYSAAWGENANAGLRLVIENQQEFPIILQSIAFPEVDAATVNNLVIELSLTVPAHGFAEQELPYVDLLSIDDCVRTTMAENWKLVEISNYTLNPSVRRLIIEDTSAFRIFQCVTTVDTQWTDTRNMQAKEYQEWVLYHFESRIDR